MKYNPHSSIEITFIFKYSFRNNFGAPFPVNRSWRDSHYPSWWEFVQYLLQTSPHRYSVKELNLDIVFAIYIIIFVQAMTSTGGRPHCTALCAPASSTTPSSTSRISRQRRLIWQTGYRPRM